MSEQTWADVPATVDLGALSGPARSAAAREKLRVDGFLILGILGQGGMGVVYKAQQQLPKRLVALKMIQTGAGATDDQLKRFRDEAEAGAKAAHQNVVQVFHVGDADGCPYIAMEYIDGPTLLEHWDGKPQPPMQVAEVVRTLALAIENAHQNDVLHRDLKPGNVLLAGLHATSRRTRGDDTWTMDAGAVPKISDFGLAKLANEETGRTYSGQIIGTPSYMAPEQAAGKKDIGPAADIWALGAILYCGLTGRAPFRGETDLDTLAMVRFQEPVSPRQLQPKVPGDLETICLKCLQKEAPKRYSSAQALADDLGRFVRNEPIIARPVSRKERLWRWCKRNPMEAILGIVLASVLSVASIGGLFLAAWALHGERLAQENAKEARANLTRAEAGEKLAQINAEESKAKERMSRRKSYALSISKAYEQDWKNGRLIEVLRRLDEQKTLAATEPNQPGFEWHYLSALCHLELKSLTGHQGTIWCVAVSPDGRWLASAGDDGTVRLWRTSTGKPVQTWKGHRGRVRSIAFSPDGQHLASVGLDGVLRIWNRSNDMDTQSESAHDSEVLSVAYSHDGKWLATASKDYTVKVWEADTRRQVQTLSGHKSFAACVRFGPDGLWLASASEDGTVKIWDRSTGLERRTLGENLGRLMSLAISSDGDLVAAGAADGRVKVWSLARAELVFDKRAPGQIWSLAFNPDGSRLISGSSDGTARVWNLRTHEQILLLGHKDQVLSVTYSADGRRAISAAQDCIRVWDANNSQENWTWLAHMGEVWCLAYAPDGHMLASGSSDHTVILWEPKSGEPVRTLEGHTATVFAIAFAPDGNCLASASEDQTVRIWDIKSGACVHTLEGHGSAVRCVAFSPKGGLVASGSDDGTVHLWDAGTGGTVAIVQSHTGAVRGLAFSPDGRLLAWTGISNSVRVWDVVQRQEAHCLVGRNPVGQTNPIGTAIAFSPDSRRIACGGNGLVIDVWDVPTGNELFCLFGHRSWIEGVAFSQDGMRLASASLDGTAKVWDGMTGEEILSLGNSDQSGYHALCFHPNGRQLACASVDWSIQLWDGTPDTPEHCTRRDAWSLVQFLYATGLAQSEVISRVTSDATISEDVKDKALTLAGPYGRSLVDREANRLVKSLFGQALFREEVVERVRANSMITPPVRLRALALAETFPEDAGALASASWLIVRQPGATAAAVSRALRQAEAAYRLSPRLGTIPTTLGVAYYRAGRYQEAVDKLNEAERLYAKTDSASFPPDLAVLSMCYDKLNQFDQSRVILEHLRETVKLPQWSNGKDAQHFLREAEATFHEHETPVSR